MNPHRVRERALAKGGIRQIYLRQNLHHPDYEEQAKKYSGAQSKPSLVMTKWHVPCQTIDLIQAPCVLWFIGYA